MGSILIRNLDDAVKQLLQVRASRNGRTMEAEAREILSREVTSDMHHNDWVLRWQNLGEELGEINIPERGSDNDARIPDFSRDS